MRRSTIVSVIASAIVAMTSTFAVAEVIKVPAGRSSSIGSFSLFQTETCTDGPKPKVTFKQPAHGTLSAKWQSAKINKKGPCNGKMMKAYLIYYQPKAGYRGPDAGTAVFSYPSYINGPADRVLNRKVELDVK